ncbi:spore coat U domain-containing protein [Orrella sp. JC864]|uniref:Csu type fimbrial protein n=1 Tax=Orrella sp. JC864 TaxID=3120298 RepID=UPI00300A3C7E
MGWLSSLALAFGLLGSPSAQAQPQPTGNCWVQQQATLDFGMVDPGDGAGPVSATMTFGCQVNPIVPDATVNIRICIYIGEDPMAHGYLPRRMTGDSTQSKLAYQLYFDAATTHPITPPGTNAIADTWTITVPVTGSGGSATGTFPIYGRVMSGQGVPADRYQSHPANSQFRYYFSTESIPVVFCSLPPNEDAHTAPLQFGGVYAQIEEACRLITSSDMDFGQVENLSGGLNNVSHITLMCPLGMSWQVGQDNGAHAVGNTRRMAGPGGNFITYELYRDPGRTQRWGNTLNDDTSAGTGQGNTVIDLSVYGRIEDQPAPPGSYEDTITVTLTF